MTDQDKTARNFDLCVAHRDVKITLDFATDSRCTDLAGLLGCTVEDVVRDAVRMRLNALTPTQLEQMAVSRAARRANLLALLTFKATTVDEAEFRSFLEWRELPPAVRAGWSVVAVSDVLGLVMHGDSRRDLLANIDDTAAVLYAHLRGEGGDA